LVADALQEKVKDHVDCNLTAEGLGCVFADCLADFDFLLRREKIGNGAEIKDVVDVLQELLIFDLRV
jgi:hypothetical protein